MKKQLRKSFILLLIFSAILISDTMPALAASGSCSGSKQARETALAVLSNITTADMSDEQKIMAVHDYMVINTRYDEAAYYLKQSAIGSATYSADGPILYGTGVCQGYSYAFKLYMDLLGIPCSIVSNSNHAWNKVTIGGVSYEIDVTWDDPIPDRGAVDVSQISHQFFLLSSEEMAIRHAEG